MKNNPRIAILIFLTPIFLGLLFVLYYQESWERMIERLVRSGVVAIYEGGTVTREDIQNYFEFPPLSQGPILRALELNPEDVSEIEEEEAEWLKSPQFQLLLSRVIKHIALVKYLNEQPEAAEVELLKNVLKTFREEIMVETMGKELAKVRPEVTQKEMMAYYLEHRDEFYREGKRYVRHIMLYENELGRQSGPFETTLDGIWERLQAGEDFRDLIFETTPDSISNVGELGWLPKGALAESFDRALWALEVKEITGPIQVNNTFHFIQLMDLQSEGLLPFEDCVPKIREIMLEKKRIHKQYALLGLSENLLNMPKEESSKTYREAVLRSAYALELDKSKEVNHKIEAFARYRRADVLFHDFVNQTLTRLRRPKGSDVSWIHESETLQNVLKKMEFRFIVKLDFPATDRIEEEYQSDELKQTAFH